MGILLTVLFCIVLFAVFVVAVLVISPFQAVISGGYREYAFSGSVLLSFIHPKIIMIDLDISKRLFRLKLFGHTFGKKKKESEKRGSGEAESDEETRNNADVEISKSPESRGNGEVESRGDAEKKNVEKIEKEEEPEKRRSGETERKDEAGSRSERETEKGEAGETAGAGEGGKQDTYQLDEQERIDHTELETKVINVSVVGDQDQSIVQKPQQPSVPEYRSEQPKKKTESETGENTPLKDETASLKKETGSDAAKEKVAPKATKKDNWFTRLERNRYWFFIRNSRWRGKIIRWIFRFLRRLLHILKFDRLQLKVKAGVLNPALVGSINGWYQSLFYGLPMRKPYVVTFEPVFMKSHIEGTVSLRVGTSILRLLMPVIVALATLPWFHTLWLVWKLYRRERAYKRLAAGK